MGRGIADRGVRLARAGAGGLGTAAPLAEPLDGSLSAADAALLVAGDERAFALVGEWAGSRAVAGSEPIQLAGSFEALDQLPDVSGSGVGGGWFGWLGFGLGVEPRPAAPPRPVPLPGASLGFYDHVLRLDASGQWWFEALWTPEREQALEERRELLLLGWCRLQRGARSRSARSGHPVDIAPPWPSAASGSPPARSSRPTSACGSTASSTASPPSSSRVSRASWSRRAARTSTAPGASW